MFSYNSARATMISCQLLPHKVTFKPLLEAMAKLPREEYVPASQRSLCYTDETLAILPDRVLWSPLVFARLVQAANLNVSDCVLDIGFGTGYSTVILSALVGHVVGLESEDSYCEALLQKLLDLDVKNVTPVLGPLNKGWASKGLYDAIFIQGAIETLPSSLKHQVKEGGKILTIFHPHESKFCQAIIETKTENNWNRTILFETRVPLLSEFKAKRDFIL